MQGNSAYQGSGSYSEAYRGDQTSLILRAPAPFGTYSSNERSSVPIDNSCYRESYGASPGGRIDPYSKPLPVTHPYQTGMVEPSPMGSACVECEFSPIGGPQADLQVPRAPLLPPSPLPSSHGLPYQTPMVRTWYGNFPTNMQHCGRNTTPFPRFH